MLRALRVENYAIFRRADFEFGKGFTVITGESGAGKSLVLESLAMALGARLSADRIGPFGDAMSILAGFELAPGHPVWSILQEWGIKSDPEDPLLVIQRELSKEGRSVTRVQGTLAPVQLLRQLATRLVEFSGQHQHLRLLDPSAALAWLDRFLGLTPLANAVADAYRAFEESSRALTRLSESSRDPSYVAELRELVEEIDALGLSADEDERLGAEIARLRAGERLVQGYAHLREVIDGDRGIGALMAEVQRELDTLGRYDPALAGVRQRWEDISGLVNEFTWELQRWASELAMDPGLLDRLEERADRIARLKRRYGPTLEEVLEQGERMRRDIQRYDEIEWELGQAQRALTQRRETLHDLAEKLSQAREQGLAEASRRLTELVQAMEMPGGQVKIHQAPGPLSITGRDHVEILFAAAGGQPLKPLAKIASGGELARVALAMAVLSTADDEPDTYLFDEVDAGLGGVSAGRVGQLLRELGHTAQVIAISHQPTVAAKAHHHFVVQKTVVKDSVQSQVRPVSGREREDEIARMLSGTDTGIALSHARELLDEGAGRA